MKSLIILAAIFYSLSGLAQDKKASPFSGDKKPLAKPATATAAPATSAPATAAPAKKTETPKAADDTRADGDTPTDNSVGDTIECKSGTDTRKIVTKAKDAGCEVEYTKFGDTKVLGGAQNDKTVCTNVVDKVRATLEASGFTCN